MGWSQPHYPHYPITRITPRPTLYTNEVIGTQIDEEDEEEQYDSEIDELGW